MIRGYSSPEIIFWDKTGPLIKYSDGIFTVEDLNPQKHITWRLSRRELFGIAVRALWAIIRRV